MATLSVVYPRAPGATFDYDYYQNEHLPLAGRRWASSGMVGGEAYSEKHPLMALMRRTSRSASCTSSPRMRFSLH